MAVKSEWLCNRCKKTFHVKSIMHKDGKLCRNCWVVTERKKNHSPVSLDRLGQLV